MFWGFFFLVFDSFLIFIFCFCFECVWGKVNPSFVCWAIVRTKTHATCNWDHLWNDGLWIKPTLMPTFVKVAPFKLFIIFSIPTCGVGCPPHVMTKFKRDENLAGLIWASKVSYAKGLNDVWDSQNWTRSSSKNDWKGDHLTCKSPWIGDDLWPISSITFNFHFKFALCFKHVFPKFYSLVCVYAHFKIWSTTKEAFIVDLVKIILAN